MASEKFKKENKKKSGSGGFSTSGPRSSISSVASSRVAPEDYEEMIQKYEGDIRNHIKVEQQMKLHSDSIIDRLEDKEKECDSLELQLEKLEKQVKLVQKNTRLELSSKEEEIAATKRALDNRVERVVALEQEVRSLASMVEGKHLKKGHKAGKSFDQKEYSTMAKASSRNIKTGTSSSPSSSRFSSRGKQYRHLKNQSITSKLLKKPKRKTQLSKEEHFCTQFSRAADDSPLKISKSFSKKSFINNPPSRQFDYKSPYVVDFFAKMKKPKKVKQHSTEDISVEQRSSHKRSKSQNLAASTNQQQSNRSHRRSNSSRSKSKKASVNEGIVPDNEEIQTYQGSIFTLSKPAPEYENSYAPKHFKKNKKKLAAAIAKVKYPSHVRKSSQGSVPQPLRKIIKKSHTRKHPSSISWNQGKYTASHSFSIS